MSLDSPVRVTLRAAASVASSARDIIRVGSAKSDEQWAPGEAQNKPKMTKTSFRKNPPTLQNLVHTPLEPDSFVPPELKLVIEVQNPPASKGGPPIYTFGPKCRSSLRPESVYGRASFRSRGIWDSKLVNSVFSSAWRRCAGLSVGPKRASQWAIWDDNPAKTISGTRRVRW